MNDGFWRTIGWLLVLLPATLCGCSGPNAQVARCQAEKQELLAVIEQEKQRSAALQERQLALETRLGESEKELARVGRPGATFGVEEPRVASSKTDRPLAPKTQPDAKLEKDKPGDALPWKAPSSGDKPTKSGLREMKLKAPGQESAGSRLATLAQRDPRLEYDEESGVARLKLEKLFDQGGAELTAEGRRQLDELAAWLKSSQTADLKVLVAGQSSGMKKPPAGADEPRFASDRELGAARAMAVANYLDSHGIKDDRLAVAASGARHGSSSPAAGAVEILLAEPDTEMAGIWPAGSKLR